MVDRHCSETEKDEIEFSDKQDLLIYSSKSSVALDKTSPASNNKKGIFNFT